MLCDRVILVKLAIFHSFTPRNDLKPAGPLLGFTLCSWNSPSNRQFTKNVPNVCYDHVTVYALHESTLK